MKRGPASSVLGREAARAAHRVEKAAALRFAEAVADVVRLADGPQLRLDFTGDDWREREVAAIFGPRERPA